MSRVQPSFVPTASDTIDLNGGYVFSSDVPFLANGTWWYQLSDGPASVEAQLWRVSDVTKVATSGAFSTSGMTPNAWNFVPFTADFLASSGVDYIVSNHYSGHALAGNGNFNSQFVDPTGHFTVPSGGGRYHLFSAAIPDNNWNGCHSCDLEFDLNVAGSEYNTNQFFPFFA